MSDNKVSMDLLNTFFDKKIIPQISQGVGTNGKLPNRDRCKGSYPCNENQKDTRNVSSTSQQFYDKFIDLRCQFLTEV